MRRWFQQITAATWMLWFFAVSAGSVSVLALDGSGMPKRAEAVSRIVLGFVIASWVVDDARKRGRRLCYDYDSFVYFAWPVLVPIYLFQTRGVRAFLTLLWFAGIWLVAASAALLVSLVRELVATP